MLEINLLPKKKRQETQALKANTTYTMIAVVILIVAFLGVLFLVGYKTMKTATLNSIESKVSDLKAEEATYAQLESDAKTLQNQMQNIESILENHTYWHAMFDELSKHVPAKLILTDFTAESDRRVAVQGTAVTYAELARFMVSLREGGGGKFSNIKLLSAGLSDPGKPDSTVSFNVTFEFDQNLLKATLTNSNTKEPGPDEEADIKLDSNVQTEQKTE